MRASCVVEGVWDGGRTVPTVRRTLSPTRGSRKGAPKLTGASEIPSTRKWP